MEPVKQGTRVNAKPIKFGSHTAEFETAFELPEDIAAQLVKNVVGVNTCQRTGRYTLVAELGRLFTSVTVRVAIGNYLIKLDQAKRGAGKNDV
jgi:hypothetical protein